jgi:hypothetical protein
MVGPNETVRNHAKNYLSALPPNSILFTYGDNDTYPLWWVQEAENYRKDVAVINNSLLGMPAYVHRIKEKPGLAFASGPELYGDPGFIYYTLDEKAAGNQKITLSQLLKYISEKKSPSSSESYGTIYSYPTSSVTMQVDTVKFKYLTKQGGFTNRMELSTGYYLLNNEFILLDIVNTNFYTRPIYFTAHDRLFEGYFQDEGFVSRLLPLDPSKEIESEKISIQKKQAFLKNNYIPIRSTDISTGISFSTEELNVFPVYASIAYWYFEQGKREEAKTLVNELLARYDGEIPLNSAEINLYYILAATGEHSAVEKLEAFAVKLKSYYDRPDSNYGYISKKETINYLETIITSLRSLNLSSKKITEIRESLDD